MNPLHLSPQYLARLDRDATQIVRARSRISVLLHIALYLVALAATPLPKRHPTLSLSFFGIIVGISIFRLIAPKQRVMLFSITTIAAGASWGLFAGAVEALFELSWTSFLVLLTTITLGAAEVPILAPRFSLLRIFLPVLLGPLIAVNIVALGGLKGFALGGFAAVFLTLLLGIGWRHHREYWTASINTARLHAMIDALPGTISWVTSGLQYLGVNRVLAERWSLKVEDFEGKHIGFNDPDTKLRGFANNLFKSSGETAIDEMQVQIAGTMRDFYIAGHKYNSASEAVILGLDVTDYKQALKDVEFHKAQSRYAAKLAILGEVTGTIADEIQSPIRPATEAIQKAQRLSTHGKLTSENIESLLQPIRENLARISRTAQALHHFAVDSADEPIRAVHLKELIDDATTLCSERFRQISVKLEIMPFSTELIVSCCSSQTLEVLLMLLNQAFFSTQKEEDPWVKIEVVTVANQVEISVSDNGKPLPAEIRDNIFEMKVSTRETGLATGLAFSLSKETLERNGGQLWLDTRSEHNRFVMSLPLIA